MADRVKRLLDCAGGKIDALVFFNGAEPHLDNTFFYVTGLVNGLFEGSAAIVPRKGKVQIVTSLLEEESARKSKASVRTYKTRDDRRKVLAEALGKYKTIGFNAEELTYHGYRVLKQASKARFVDMSKAVLRARMVKDREEVARIREAAKIASKAADKIPDMLSQGMREFELAASINHEMQKLGATGPSFTTISSFGPNTAEPHYTSGAAKLKKGQFVLADFGALYNKYVSDITRTFVFGKASAKQRDMYETVLRAQEIALDAIKAGVDGRRVDKKVRKYIDSTKYEGRFIHSTGHSIGLAVHDGGIISSATRQPLEDGMVFTVEPGVYLPGFGGVRIEDNVVVRKGGYEMLTSARKSELIEV